MRFLGVGDACELGSLYLRLRDGGHQVKVFIADELCHGTLAGMVERIDDWRRELEWVGRDGIILFENVAKHRGALQDELRAQGYRVIGGSAFGDRLENERAYAQRVLADAGMAVCRTFEFVDRAQAIGFVAEHPARYVLKFNGWSPTLRSYAGHFPDGRDVAALLAQLPPDVASGFVLMEYIDGIEMGVGAYFNGEHFLLPACLDWEHKRFFPKDLGELTGEMGTVVTYQRTQAFFENTLHRMEALLHEQRYCGYINLNTVVNETGIWPIEFTCRFGYPGFAILDPLQETSWAELFEAMVTRSSLSFKTAPGFAVGIVLTTPPFPYERAQVPEPVGLPVLFEGGLTAEDRRHLHFGEVGLDDGKLVTSGTAGWTMVVTGVGASIARAQADANKLAGRVRVPNLRYRCDIGQRLIEGDFERVEALGLLSASATAGGSPG